MRRKIANVPFVSKSASFLLLATLLLMPATCTAASAFAANAGSNVPAKHKNKSVEVGKKLDVITEKDIGPYPVLAFGKYEKYVGQVFLYRGSTPDVLVTSVTEGFSHVKGANPNSGNGGIPATWSFANKELTPQYETFTDVHGYQFKDSKGDPQKYAVITDFYQTFTVVRSPGNPAIGVSTKLHWLVTTWGPSIEDK